MIRRIQSFPSKAQTRRYASILIGLAVHLFVGGPAGQGALAQLPEKVINQPCTACGANSVFAADLDSDGDEDVLSASEEDGKIAWHENLDSGGFSHQKVITTRANGARAVFAADLDGDGDQDVLSASEENLGSEEDNRIAWYENLDSGGFSDQNIISTRADAPTSLFAADLDGDGDQDVLSASEDDDKIAWYENVDSGRFSEPNVISTRAERAQSVFAADLDADGDQDVLSASVTDDKVAWYENLDSDGFSDQKIISTSEDAPVTVFATDLDGDDDMDVLSIFLGENKLAWYENMGDGSFSDENVITESLNIPLFVSAADLDEDDDMDVLSVSIGAPNIAWYENTGDGSFSNKNVINNSGDNAVFVVPVDLDGDSHKDVLFASPRDDKVAWHENHLDQGQGFSTSRAINTIPDVDQPVSVFASDLDEDGDLDVLSASNRDDKIAWYENLDSAEFSDQNVISTSAEGARSIFAADLDGDSDKDVLSASTRDDKIAWYENLDSGGFSATNVVSTNANGAVSVVAADLDGDSDKDVLSASVNDNKIAWYENTGGGSFSSQNIISTRADDATSAFAADLDGDSDIDVLSASSGDNKIAWYENAGGGSFSSQNIISTAAEDARSVFAADLDGDTDIDVLSASSGDDKIAWYENQLDQGNGFSSKGRINTLPYTEFPISVFAADLDEDGDEDILSATNSDDKIAWYENLDSGGFSDANVVSTEAIGAISVFAADLDGDSDKDIISASVRDDKIAWYQNPSALSVELTSFDGSEISPGTVRLTWRTATETSNSGFHVERRTGHESEWRNLAFVDGAGTTSEVRSYSYTDADLPYESDSLAYRLEQVDVDGTPHFSQEIVVQRGVEEVELLETYPNPTSRQATIRFALPDRRDVMIHLYDILGREVRTVISDKKRGRHEHRLDLRGLASGMYVLQLKAGGEVVTRKLTVVR